MLNLFTNLSLGQSGSVYGLVKQQDAPTPIADANVVLEGTTFGGVTSSDGTFHLNHIPAGTYQLVVSHINYDPWDQTIVVNSDQRTDLQVNLSETENTLTNVVVTATRTERSVDEVPIYYQGNASTEAFSNFQTRPASRHYTFRYAVQSNGSRDF